MLSSFEKLFGGRPVYNMRREMTGVKDELMEAGLSAYHI